jgi:hypothetical protein
MPKRIVGLARLALVAGLLATGAWAGPAAAQEAPGPIGPAVLGGCRAALGVQGEPACRMIEQQLRVASMVCRAVGGPPEACAQFNGLVISDESVAAYEGSWVHEAHALQRALDDTTPLRQALFPATHNSTNSAAYTPTLSRSDHNQIYSVRDQLRMDMRSIEIDVHWSPSIAGDPAQGGRAPVTCHATEVDLEVTVVHAGCTTEESLDVALAELDGWLEDNPTEVIVLYLENGLEGSKEAEDAAAAMIDSTIGSHVYKPPASQPCAPMPTQHSRDDIRAAGAQVLIVGNCDPAIGSGWGGWVHERDQGNGTWSEDKSGVGNDYDCTAERADKSYDTTFIRFYEDSTGLSYAATPTGQGSPGQITGEETAEMAACGVNLFGFDQLHPGDARLARLIWSWAPLGWTSGDCAYSGSLGTFHSGRCDTKRRAACQDPATGAWTVTAKAVPFADAAKACKKAAFAVPATGWDNTQLRTAKTAAGATEVWLNYAEVSGTWTPRAATA